MGEHRAETILNRMRPEDQHPRSATVPRNDEPFYRFINDGLCEIGQGIGSVGGVNRGRFNLNAVLPFRQWTEF